MLQSRKGGQTCGHLHVGEADAWRCRGVQEEPGAWLVASAWLSVKDERQRHVLGYVPLLWLAVVLTPVAVVATVAALVVALVEQSWEVAFVCVFGLWFWVLFFVFTAQWFRQAIGCPAIVARVFGR